MIIIITYKIIIIIYKQTTMTKTHSIIHFDSSKRAKAYQSLSQFTFKLNLPVQFNKTENCDYYVKVSELKVPQTFYQVNSNYNTFTVEEFNGVATNVVSFNLPQGNYTVSELASDIQASLNAGTGQGNIYTLQFDVITGKVNIAFSGGSTQITVKGTGTVNPGIGFDTTDRVITTNLDSPNVANVNFLKYITLRSNLAFSNNFEAEGVSRILKKIQLTGDRYDNIVDDNKDGYELELSGVSTIKAIDFEWRDSNNNLVEFNGSPSNGTIVISKYEKHQRVVVVKQN